MDNQINHLTQNDVKVIIRLRPSDKENHDKSCIKIQPGNNNVCSISYKSKKETFSLDQIFDSESTQQEMFETVGKNYVDSFL